MHIHTYFILFIFIFVLVFKCDACLPIIPEDGVGIPGIIANQLQNLPDFPPFIKVIPVAQLLKSELEKVNKKLISKTAEVSVISNPFKPFTEIFAGCRLDNIKFTSSEAGRKLGKTIIPPELSCSKKSLIGCQAATLVCNVPPHSNYPLISGFAKIDGADWATTDLKVSKAIFHLECDIYNRWTYISDIPGLEGKVYATNEVSCLLVPIITENNTLDFEENVNF